MPNPPGCTAASTDSLESGSGDIGRKLSWTLVALSQTVTVFGRLWGSEQMEAEHFIRNLLWVAPADLWGSQPSRQPEPQPSHERDGDGEASASVIGCTSCMSRKGRRTGVPHTHTHRQPEPAGDTAKPLLPPQTSLHLEAFNAGIKLGLADSLVQPCECELPYT